jgi:hypothetical protein
MGYFIFVATRSLLHKSAGYVKEPKKSRLPHKDDWGVANASTTSRSLDLFCAGDQLVSSMLFVMSFGVARGFQPLAETRSRKSQEFPRKCGWRSKSCSSLSKRSLYEHSKAMCETWSCVRIVEFKRRHLQWKAPTKARLAKATNMIRYDKIDFSIISHGRSTEVPDLFGGMERLGLRFSRGQPSHHWLSSI